ncbi:MAG: HAMP domain-containing protein, partial [Cyanobacteria bacterium J06639_1]
MLRTPSRSLRLKFTLALLATSAAAVASVGGMALWMMDREFNRLVLEEAFERFQGDVARYIETHGSWDTAQQIESFREFNRRTRALQSPPKNVPSFRQPPASGRRPPPGNPARVEVAKPPFHFLLLDPQGTVLMGPKGHQVGAKAERSLQRKGMEIHVEGEMVAMAVPIDRPNLNDLDRAYLVAVRDSLIYGGLLAAGVTVTWGIWVGRRLTHPLTELTAAIQAMTQGELRQRVAVRAQDELGTLTESFNRMSFDLADAYEELEVSNCTIREQADRLRELTVRDELTQLYN